MSECRMPSCPNPTGMQDRDDYRTNTFCSVGCEMQHSHLKADARDARRSDQDVRGDGMPVGSPAPEEL